MRRNISATTTIAILREPFAKYGLPVQCVIENSPQFRSEELEHFMKVKRRCKCVSCLQINVVIISDKMFKTKIFKCDSKCVYYRRVNSVLWMKTQGNSISIWLSSKYIRKGYVVFYLQWSLFLPIKTQISRLKQLIVFFNLLYEWLSFVLSNVTSIASLWASSFLRCLQTSVVIYTIHWSNIVWIISKINLL